MKQLIARLGRYFATDLSYVFRAGGWLALEQTGGNLMNILITVAFANLVSPETYGTYRYVLSIFGILTIFTLPSMNIALTTSVAKGYEGSFLRALMARIRWGFVGSVIAVGIAAYYFLFKGDAMLGAALLLMAAALPFQDSLNLWSGYLRGKQLFRLQTVYSLSVRLLSALALVGSLFLTRNLLWILAALWVPYIVLRLVVLLSVVRRFAPERGAGDPSLVSYGKHLSGIQLMNVLANSLDNLLIFNLLGPAALAIYSIALLPITKAQQFLSVLTELALPKFSARNAGDIRRTLLRRIFRMLLFVAGAVVIYLVFAPLLFPIIFPRYPNAVRYSLVLAFALFAFPFAFIYTFFQSQAMKRAITHYNVSIRIAQVFLVAVLVPIAGIWGAVIARLGFQVVSVAVLSVLFRRGTHEDRVPAQRTV